MKKITLSLNPTYLCNFRCDFCYLTPEQLSDKKKIPPKRLEEMLLEIESQDYYVDHVDIYGGEVSLLSLEYLTKLDEILYEFLDPSINVITNLSKIHPYLLKEHVELSVSFDFEAREKHELVLQNMIRMNKDIAILLLASPELMEIDLSYIINTLNHIKNITSVEIKPYSSNQANKLGVQDIEFEEYIKKWLKSPLPKNFTFINESKINESLSGSYNAYSDDHVYITPNGKFGVLEFDKNNDEFFLELDTFKEYIDWSNKEKELVNNNKFCNICEYKGKCLTEHYRNVESLDNSCNGFKNLLDWVKNHPQ